MKKHFSLVLLVGVILIVAVGRSAADLDDKAKAWLGAHKDAPAVNVNGNWHAKDWGMIVLHQAQDSRDVTGDGDGWDITGVVSGNQAFLLFTHKSKVNYTAQLTAQPDGSLNGSYSRGFMSEKTAHKPMLMTKQ